MQQGAAVDEGVEGVVAAVGAEGIDAAAEGGRK